MFVYQIRNTYSGFFPPFSSGFHLFACHNSSKYNKTSISVFVTFSFHKYLYYKKDIWIQILTLFPNQLSTSWIIVFIFKLKLNLFLGKTLHKCKPFLLFWHLSFDIFFPKLFNKDMKSPILKVIFSLLRVKKIILTLMHPIILSTFYN